MKARHRRAVLLLGAVGLLALAGGLAARALQSNLVFFVTPSQLAAGARPQGQALRVGGYVRPGSLQRHGDGSTVEFVLSDAGHAVAVRYQGVLPDLFAEGQGAVAQGRLQPDGHLAATEVLAKHDEHYRPPGAGPAPAPGAAPAPAPGAAPALAPAADRPRAAAPALPEALR